MPSVRGAEGGEERGPEQATTRQRPDDHASAQVVRPMTDSWTNYLGRKAR
jgi:hypothetical protein